MGFNVRTVFRVWDGGVRILASASAHDRIRTLALFDSFSPILSNY